MEAAKYIGLSVCSICTNLFLMVVKVTAGVLGHSHALIADGIESGADVVSSLVTWIGFHLSLRPADDCHPFGHGKIESLTGLFAGCSLLCAAGLIAYHAVLEILSPQQTPSAFTLPVVIGVIVIKLLLSRWLRAAGDSVESRAIQGEAHHHLSDALTSAAAAIGISIAILGGPGWEAADDWAALIACAIICVNGLRICNDSLHELLDGHVHPDFQEDFHAHALAHPQVNGLDKCLMRKSGVRYFAELHVEVNGDLSVRAGHDIAHEVKADLLEKFPQLLDIVVHVEPA